LYALKAFQRPIYVPVPILFFKSCERIPVYSSTNRKEGTKNAKKNLAKKEPTDALAGYENSNDIQKHFEHPA